MSKLDKHQRLDLLGLAPQGPAAPLARIKLDADESPVDWPAELKAGWTRQFEARPWNRYPAGDVDLRRAIAEPWGLTHEWIALAAGTSEALRQLYIAWCLRGTVIYPVPTDPRYGLIAQALGIKHVAVMLKADFTLPLEQVIATAKHQQANLVLVANPNNPTGNLFSRDELLTIAREAPSLVVVDESFIDFTGLSLADALADHDNLAIIRSFSHAWGAAAFGLAYVMAHPRVITELDKVRSPHAVPTPTLMAGQWLLHQHGHLAAGWHAMAQARDAMRQALTQVRGVVSWPSAANFLLVGTTLDGTELARRLLELGIAVRPFDRSPLKNCIRVSVGTPEENAAFVEAMTSLFGPADPAGF